MDISTVKPVSRHIEIKHPATGEPIGVRVEVVSVDDERLTPIKRKIQDRSMYLQQRSKTFKSDEIEENTRELLWTATIGWEWYSPTGEEADQATFEGNVPEFNVKNFNKVTKALPWFQSQINEEVGETKAFFDQSERS